MRGCSRSSFFGGCDSVTFPSARRPYSHVCGKVNAYQKASSDAFHASFVGSLGLEGAYVDGFSLTHGTAGSWQHVWSFAAALVEVHTVPLPIRLCTWYRH